MAESQWASAHPTPPPPAMLPGLVFSSFKVFSKLSLFSLHPHHCRWRCLLPVSPPLVATGFPSLPLKFIFSFIFVFVPGLIILMTRAVWFCLGLKNGGFGMSLFYCVNTCHFVRELLSEWNLCSWECLN